MLWLGLDLILFTQTIPEKGSALLILGASILGSILISIYLFNQRKLIWSWSETLSSILIVFSIFIWIIVKDTDTAIVTSVMCQVFAGIPLTIKSHNEPEKGYLVGYVFFIFSCIFLLFFEGNALKKFNLEDHLLAIALGLHTAIDCLIIIFRARSSNGLGY